MKAKIDKGQLSIGLYELLEGCDKETLMELVDSLACLDSVIEQVMNQVLDGWTDMSSHGCDDTEKTNPFYPIGKFRKAIVDRMGDVANERFRQIERRADHQEEWAKE